MRFASIHSAISLLDKSLTLNRSFSTNCLRQFLESFTTNDLPFSAYLKLTATERSGHKSQATVKMEEEMKVTKHRNFESDDDDLARESHIFYSSMRPSLSLNDPLNGAAVFCSYQGAALKNSCALATVAREGCGKSIAFARRKRLLRN
ncbi:hypothetical protein AB6A40_006101 [Gnathostoma spinigerum]|uniref:Uncharacterized protein n=1 Tax=Gnathostoma spinigerum TaxID=75299 RepID=A0ABD6EJK1_9BILA